MTVAPNRRVATAKSKPNSQKPKTFERHLVLTWVDEIVHYPAILNAVEDLIGPNIWLFHRSVSPESA